MTRIKPDKLTTCHYRRILVELYRVYALQMAGNPPDGLTAGNIPDKYGPIPARARKLGIVVRAE